jgi:DNA-binding IclR family transcriptional regulator
VSGSAQLRSKAPAGTQTLARGIQIVEFLLRADHSQRPADIARATGIQRSAVYRLLHELEHHSYVAREADTKRYTVGSGLVAIASLVFNKVDIRRFARPAMEELGQQTQETISLHVRRGTKRICIDVVPSPQPISRVVLIGETLPVYAGPTGKAILAYVEGGDRKSLLTQAVRDAATSMSELQSVLEGIHFDGYVASIGDRTPEVGGLSAPVFNAEGVLGSMTISGPAARWTLEKMQQAASSLVSASTRLSVALGHVETANRADP